MEQKKIAQEESKSASDVPGHPSASYPKSRCKGRDITRASGPLPAPAQIPHRLNPITPHGVDLIEIVDGAVGVLDP